MTDSSSESDWYLVTKWNTPTQTNALVNWERGTNKEWGVSFLFMFHKTKTEQSPPIKDPFIAGFTSDWEHVSSWWFPHSCLWQTEPINTLKVSLTTEGDVDPVLSLLSHGDSSSATSHLYRHVVHYGLLCCGNELGTASNFMKMVFPRPQNRRLKPYFLIIIMSLLRSGLN